MEGVLSKHECGFLFIFVSLLQVSVLSFSSEARTHRPLLLGDYLALFSITLLGAEDPRWLNQGVILPRGENIRR